MTRTLSPYARFFGMPIAALVLLLLVATTGAQPLLAQTSGDEPSEDDMKRYYSLYFEDYKNENYAMALPNLEWILENAPQFPRNDDRNFRRAVRAHESLAQRADAEEEQMEHLYEALDLLENAPERIEELGLEHDAYRWARLYGRFLQANARYFDDDDLPQTEVDAYLSAYEMDPERMDPYYINRIIEGLTARDRQEALDFMDRLENERDDPEVMEMITGARDELFTSPEERYEFVVGRLEDTPENAELLQERYDLEERMGMREQMYETAEKLLDLQPSAQAYFDVGTMYLEDGEQNEAIARFERALQQDDLSDELRADVEFELGNAYRQQDRLPRARRHYRNALNIDSSYGAAYLAIGDLYTQAVANCEGPMDREDRAVYWLAVEYYERARTTDPAMERAANQKIRTFRQYFPDQEALFFRDDWEVGEPFRIDYGCYSWINESTTVRAPA